MRWPTPWRAALWIIAVVAILAALAGLGVAAAMVVAALRPSPLELSLGAAGVTLATFLWLVSSTQPTNPKGNP